MSDLATHERHCVELFGVSFREVHEFLDQNYDPDKHPFTSVQHRSFLHHYEGISEVCKTFGMIALLPAIVHILDDCLGYIPRRSDYEDGSVDEFGRPRNQKLMDTHWLERLKTIYSHSPPGK